MANITNTIPDNQILRVKNAFVSRLQDGDASDMENPTNQEILVVVKRYLSDTIKRVVLDYERHKYQIEFIENDIDII